jgi:hypothetical protein
VALAYIRINNNKRHYRNLRTIAAYRDSLCGKFHRQVKAYRLTLPPIEKVVSTGGDHRSAPAPSTEYQASLVTTGTLVQRHVDNDGAFHGDQGDYWFRMEMVLGSDISIAKRLRGEF